MFGDPALELVVNRRVPAAPCQRRSLARPDPRPRDRVQVDGVDTATGLGKTGVLKKKRHINIALYLFIYHKNQYFTGKIINTDEYLD